MEPTDPKTAQREENQEILHTHDILPEIGDSVGIPRLYIPH